MSQRNSRRFLTPTLVVSALAVVTLVFIGGVIVGSLLPSSVTAAPDSLSSWVSALSTAVVCVLTIVLAIETWRLRAAQTRQIAELMLENIRPNVSVELTASHVGMNIMNVRVVNSGKGIARRISFVFLNRDGLPATPENEPIVKVFHKLAMFRLGIQSLGIGQELKSFLFSFFALGGEIQQDIFKPFVNIKIQFEDVEGNQYFNIFTIDFAQYEGVSQVGGDSLHQLASEVKTIREHFARFGGAGQRLAVDIFNSTDRSEEDRQAEMYLEELRRERAE